MTASAETPLLMLSAMYENGGNTTHRFLDGHPELFVYPFESQIGTAAVDDFLASVYPRKYRWPEFKLSNGVEQDYRAIIDEEGKVRARTPHVSKFRDRPFDMNDDERMRSFVGHMAGVERTRPALVSAFFQATFDSWKDHQRSGREHVYVGYSPIIAVDAEKILEEMPNAHVLQVVRNPWSAYADTKKRAVPLSLDHYTAGWVIVQTRSLAARAKFPDRMHILRFEDIIDAPAQVLGNLLATMGVSASDTLSVPSWNGQPLTEVYPWGTIRTPTAQANAATGAELSQAERDEVTRRTATLLAEFQYA